MKTRTILLRRGKEILKHTCHKCEPGELKACTVEPATLEEVAHYYVSREEYYEKNPRSDVPKEDFRLSQEIDR